MDSAVRVSLWYVSGYGSSNSLPRSCPFLTIIVVTSCNPSLLAVSVQRHAVVQLAEFDEVARVGDYNPPHCRSTSCMRHQNSTVANPSFFFSTAMKYFHSRRGIHVVQGGVKLLAHANVTHVGHNTIYCGSSIYMPC